MVKYDQATQIKSRRPGSAGSNDSSSWLPTVARLLPEIANAWKGLDSRRLDATLDLPYNRVPSRFPGAEAMMQSAVLQRITLEASIEQRRQIMIPADRTTPPATGRPDDFRLHNASGAPLRILIVDDDPTVASVLQDMINEAGGQSMGIITSALAAIGAAAVISPDVVLMDVRLPGSMDGVEATEVIRARGSAAVVIITGAGADPEIRARLMALEGVEIIFKPVLEPELCGAILRAYKPRAPR